MSEPTAPVRIASTTSPGSCPAEVSRLSAPPVFLPALPIWTICPIFSSSVIPPMSFSISFSVIADAPSAATTAAVIMMCFIAFT